MAETIELRHGRVTFEERPGYLFVVEEGTLRSVAEVEKYASAIELVVQRTGLTRVLIDSRGTEPVGRDDGVRDALWKWLVSGQFDQMAFVLSSELQVTSVNMIALSSRARIRGFVAVHEAHRWLTGRQRTMSQALSAQSLPAQGATRTPPQGVPSPSTLPPARPDRSPASASDRPPPRPSERKTGEYEAQPPAPRALRKTGELEATPPASRALRKTVELEARGAPPTRRFDSIRKSDVVPALAVDDTRPRKKVDET